MHFKTCTIIENAKHLFHSDKKTNAKNEKTRIFEKNRGIKLQKTPWLEVAQNSHPEKKHAANHLIEN